MEEVLAFVESATSRLLISAPTGAVDPPSMTLANSFLAPLGLHPQLSNEWTGALLRCPPT